MSDLNKYRISRLKICLIFIILFVIFMYIIAYKNTLTGKITAILLMGLCLYNMYKSKNNILGFILHFQLFYYNYSVVFSRYLHYVNEYENFYNNTNIEILNLGILCLFIFETFITFYWDNSKPFKKELIYAKQKNEFISILLLIISTAIGFFAFNWGDANDGIRTSVSITPYYEYIGILLILGLYYSGFEKSKIIKYGYSLLIIFLVLQGFVFGERVSALQFIFIWLFYFKGDKMQPKKVFLIAIVGIFIMNVIGFYRSSYSFANTNLLSILDFLSNRLLTFNGADLGYYCSLTFIMVAKISTVTTRISMFIKFLISILIGTGPEYNLASYTYNYYPHWFGGYFPLYFYFYGGFLMVIFSSYFWGKFICKCLKKNNSKYSHFLYLLGLYLVCICARWYMYTPVNAFRSTLIFSIVYFLLYLFDKNYKEAK